MVSTRKKPWGLCDAWQLLDWNIKKMGLTAFRCLHCWKIKDESVIREHLKAVHGVPYEKQDLVYATYFPGKPKKPTKKRKQACFWEKAEQNKAMEKELKSILREGNLPSRIREARELEREQLSAWYGISEEIEFEREARKELAKLRFEEEIEKIEKRRKGHPTH